MPDGTTQAGGLYALLGTITLIVTGIVSIPVWINKKFNLQTEEMSKQKNEMYKVLSANKEACVNNRERVKILEVKQEADSSKLLNVEAKVDGIDEKLNKMQLENKESQLTLLTAIHNIGRASND